MEIQSIDTTSLNTRELRAKYSLLHAMALDKNYINASNIQIIEPALRFYTHKGRYRMLANFYAGRIYENNQDYANALIHYNDALDNASEQDYLYLGLIHSYIANVYHSTYAFKEELLHKEIASECFEKLGEQHYIDLGIFGLANAWHNNHNFQKADSLYREICEQGDSLRSIAILAKIARADNAVKSEKYDPNEILKLYEFALENSGEMSLEDYYEYAYILTKLGYHADANNILEQLSVYPATYASYWWRYKIEQEKGNLNNAALMLEESIELQNDVVKEKISQSVFKSQSEFYRHAMLSTQQETDRLLEYAQNRLLAGRIVSALQTRGLDASLLVPEETDISLPERCRRVNEWCRQLGKDNVLLISIHCNAAGRGDRWLSARGWCAYTTRGNTRADALATSLYTAAQAHLPGMRLRTDYTDGDPDLEKDFYLLRHTSCPAVLTENLFMDNHADCDFLLSPEGQQSLIDLHVDGINSFLNR